MAEIIERIIDDDLCVAIEDALVNGVTGDEVLAHASETLEKLALDALTQFCEAFNITTSRAVWVAKNLGPFGRSITNRLHPDGVDVYTLGLSTDPFNNANTITIAGDDLSQLKQQHNSEFLRLGTVAYTSAALANPEINVHLVQPPRGGGVFISPGEYHCAPLLRGHTQRLLLLASD